MPQEQKQNFEVPNKVTRATIVESNAVVNEQRIVELSFASATPIDKGGYWEVLSHRAEDVNFDWINSGHCPVITDHEAEADNVVGKVISAWLDGDVSRAKVLIGNDEESTVIWDKIQSGILSNVSVGAKITAYTVDRSVDESKPTVICKWEPSELSFCALPIDRSIGVGRSEKNSNDDTKVIVDNGSTVIDPSVAKPEVNQDGQVSRSDADNKALNVVVPDQIQIQIKQNQKQSNNKGLKMTTENLSTEDIQRAERLRTNEIYAIADQLKASREDVQRAVESGQAAGDFALAIMRAQAAKPVQAQIGLTNQEAKEFSIARATQAVVTGDYSDAGYELEVSRAYAKANGKAQTAKNIFVPDEVLFRAAGAQATTFANNTQVGLKTRGAWIDALRAKTIAGRLGVNMLGGLVGTLELPRFLTLPQARIVGEGQDGTIDAVTSGVVTLAPRSVISLVELTRSMVSNLPSIEAQLNAELLAAIATKLDQEVFATILADTDVSWGTTPTAGVNYAEIRALITRLSNADVNTDNARFAMNGDVEGYLSSTLKSDNTAALYLRGEDGKVAGLQSEFSRTVCGDHLILGDFSKVTVGSWGAVDLSADTSTRFTSGGTVLRAITDIDVAVTVPAALTGYKSLVV